MGPHGAMVKFGSRVPHTGPSQENGGDTVDGWNLANHLGWCWNPINNGKNYQPQLVLAGFQPSTVVREFPLFISGKSRLVKYSSICLPRCIWVFPKIGGTPKSSILTGFSIINHQIWVNPPPLFLGWHPYKSLVLICFNCEGISSPNPESPSPFGSKDRESLRPMDHPQNHSTCLVDWTSRAKIGLNKRYLQCPWKLVNGL